MAPSIVRTSYYNISHKSHQMKILNREIKYCIVSNVVRVYYYLVVYKYKYNSCELIIAQILRV